MSLLGAVPNSSEETEQQRPGNGLASIVQIYMWLEGRFSSGTCTVVLRQS